MPADIRSMARELTALIAASEYIVFLGGAGVSTESGIPDFRGARGLYREEREIPPETVLSHDFFLAHPGDFYDFHRENLYSPNARPNAAHKKLAELERIGKLRAVVTQNIDGLHQLAGSQDVLELHGSALRYYCLSCGKKYGAEILGPGPGAPYCDCGGLIRPDVVLYGEPLDPDVLSAAVRHIRRADMLIVGGTSLSVYPAAGLVDYYTGSRLVLINESPTPYDSRANMLVPAKIGEIFASINTFS